MFVYVDETGNTGKNMFDKAQPFFSSLAFMTKKDFDSCYSNDFKQILKNLNISELHARCMDHDNFKLACQELANLLNNIEFNFAITFVDKITYVKTLLFDTVFDCENNLSVPWQAYWNNILRKTLLLNFYALIANDRKVLNSFWNKCLYAPSQGHADKAFQAICLDLLSKLETSTFDSRTTEIFSEAFEWMKNNPENIDYYWSKSNAEKNMLPNVTFFPGIMLSVQKTWDSWQTKNCTILHDRQIEFEKGILEIHKHTSNRDTPKYFPEGLSISQHPFQLLSGSTCKFTPASGSYGIQVSDICLTVLAKFFKNKELSESEQILLDLILTNTPNPPFSINYEVVLNEVISNATLLYNKEFTKEDEEKAKKVIEDEKNRRCKIMKKYEEAKT